MEKGILLAITMTILLILSDSITTYTILILNIGNEMNPLFAWIFRTLPIAYWGISFVIELGFFLIPLLFLFRMRAIVNKFYPQFANVVYYNIIFYCIGAIAILVYVVLNNSLILFSHL